MKRYLIPVMMLLGAAPAFAQTNAAVTPETQQKIQAARAQFREQGKPIFQDMRSTREALQSEMAKATPDDGTLKQLEDRMASDRQQLQSLHQQQQQALKAQLSPKEYAQLMLSHKHFGRRHFGNRGGDGTSGNGSK
jgi:Spy/CpxP family protein refolding chaperone